MDDVHAENNGDSKATFFYSNALQFCNTIGSFEVKHSSYFAFADRGHDIALQGTSARYDIARYGEIELPKFLFERHFVEQIRYEAVHFFVSFTSILLRCRASGKKQWNSGHAGKKSVLDGVGKIENHGC